MISQFILKSKIWYKWNKSKTGERTPPMKIKYKRQKRHYFQNTILWKQNTKRIYLYKDKKMTPNIGWGYRSRYNKRQKKPMVNIPSKDKYRTAF